MTGAANTPSYGQPEATYGQPAQGGIPVGSPGYTAAVPAGTQPYQGQQAAQPAQAPNAGTWGQPSPQPVVQAPQKDISLALFDAGVNAFNARKYEEAQRSFTDFLKNYKDHNLAPEAQYYLAECYFQRNQFADAALAYDTVIKNIPSPRARPAPIWSRASASAKSTRGRGQSPDAGTDQKFPNSPEAARARAF
ncbi:MAG: tetratricopeptide repeat protein [Desulfovibrio fairfieldensis]